MLNTIKTLTAVRAISGREKAVSDKLLKLIAPHVDNVRSDAMGSLIAFKKGTGKDGERKSRMLCAHMDEIGFLVTFIDDNGYLRIAPIGGINFVAATYSLVEFANGTKGILVPESGTAPADLRAEKFYIDIGAKDKKEAEKKVKIGDYCAVEGRVERLAGKRIAGRPLDDRIGCAMLIKIAEALKEAPCEDDVYFVFSVQEEVGIRGARTAAYGIDPDSALCFDITGTGDAIGSKPMACSVGGGAAIKIKDASVICDVEITEQLISLAKEKGIKYQCEILLHGGTDTASIQASRAGVRAGAISVPTRYIHSGFEMLDLNDVQAGISLTLAWLGAK
ncbi:MAG: M20/M25/M40 family metallo-hydrolase [Clostridia bacterium]|nr:M20/M25/M40 family metallo-hydrolase [Clostridia bacterium]